MKYLFVLLVLLASCVNEPINTTPNNKNDLYYGIQVKEVNNCQYIVAHVSGGVAVVHAANCNNPMHDYEK